MIKYILASTHDWFLSEDDESYYQSDEFLIINKKEDFEQLALKDISPQYIFFIHWNWIVPETIFNNYKCIVFHIAPLPYGRGGSPIQNLILEGFKEAPLNALKMTKVVDGGPIYASEKISLTGSIKDILKRAAKSVKNLIKFIIENDPAPKDQIGEASYFNRLTRADNAIKDDDKLEVIYDKIRMVDGLNYPRAFIDLGEYTIEFTEANINKDILVSKAVFKKNKS